MKKATKFIAECGGSFGGGSCGGYSSGYSSGCGSVSTMSDFELENAYHAGLTWSGNMVCGHWEGTSKASAEVKKEYNRRVKERQRQREEEYKQREAEYKRRIQADLKRLQAGLKTTKQSFNQDIWRQENSNIESAVYTMQSQIKYIPGQIKKYEALLKKWSKLKGYSKERIQIGKDIIDALKKKAKGLLSIYLMMKDGEGIWWNVSIDIEGGKKFLI